MKIFKKILVVFLILSIFLLTACGEEDKKNSDSSNSGKNNNNKNGSITLLYSASDTFNPYTAVTENNRQLCKLLYDSLIKLDNNFEVVNNLAKNIVLNGNVCTVTLNNKVFSDGSPVTAEDVIYSYNLAKKSNTEYFYKLYEVKNVVAEDTKTIKFTLTRSDPYFVSLIDFPVLKKDSDKIVNSDSVKLPPIGSGRYIVNNSLDGLILNTVSIDEKCEIKKINLINAPDKESIAHFVEIGAVDMYYSDISDGEILRMSGKRVSINLNRLVYIGINKNYSLLKQNELRQAISAGINRKNICTDSFFNNAIAANGFYNPNWAPVKSVQNIETESNEKITVENLKKIGYNRLDSNGHLINNGGYSLTLQLLVNSENRVRVSAARLIASQLAQYGIKIDVVEKSFDNYRKALSSGNFQLYLGEISVTPNMDLSSLYVKGGLSSFGYSGSSLTDNPLNSLENLTNGFYNGKNTINDLATVLQSELPVIPVCYRTGLLFYNEKIENVNLYSLSDIYFSIESYKINDK